VSGTFACGFRTDLHFADVSVTRSRLFFVRPLLLVYNSRYCGLRTDITPVTCYPETKSARHVPITCRKRLLWACILCTCSKAEHSTYFHASLEYRDVVAACN